LTERDKENHASVVHNPGAFCSVLFFFTRWSPLKLTQLKLMFPPSTRARVHLIPKSICVRYQLNLKGEFHARFEIPRERCCLIDNAWYQYVCGDDGACANADSHSGKTSRRSDCADTGISSKNQRTGI
jgi:hypothetical protein